MIPSQGGNVYWYLGTRSRRGSARNWYVSLQNWLKIQKRREDTQNQATAGRYPVTSTFSAAASYGTDVW